MVRTLIFCICLAGAATADLMVWEPEQVDTLLVSGKSEPVTIYFMSQFIGYGYFCHVVIADHGGCGLPDSFAVHGEAIVAPTDYSDTLEAFAALQPISYGPEPVLCESLSSLPDTLVLLLIGHAFQAPPDTVSSRWFLTGSGLERRFKMENGGS